MGQLKEMLNNEAIKTEFGKTASDVLTKTMELLTSGNLKLNQAAIISSNGRTMHEVTLITPGNTKLIITIHEDDK